MEFNPKYIIPSIICLMLITNNINAQRDSTDFLKIINQDVKEINKTLSELESKVDTLDKRMKNILSKYREMNKLNYDKNYQQYSKKLESYSVLNNDILTKYKELDEKLKKIELILHSLPSSDKFVSQNPFSIDTTILRHYPVENLDPKQLRIRLLNKAFYVKDINPSVAEYDNDLSVILHGLVAIDNKTNLMWQIKYTKDGTYDEISSKLKDLNQNSYAGYNDWRLPTVEEALTLLNKRLEKDWRGDEEIYHDCELNSFSNTINRMWTGDKFSDQNDEYQWFIDFGNGTYEYTSIKKQSKIGKLLDEKIFEICKIIAVRKEMNVIFKNHKKSEFEGKNYPR